MIPVRVGFGFLFFRATFEYASIVFYFKKDLYFRTFFVLQFDIAYTMELMDVDG